MLSDPRRLGGVELDPDLDRLGTDATTLTRAQLAAALRSRLALKAVLMDQGRIAGLGNLVDANMAQESARLQSLQVKQQLGVQALAIANQAPQTILSLFRG